MKHLFDGKHWFIQMLLQAAIIVAMLAVYQAVWGR